MFSLELTLMNAFSNMFTIWRPILPKSSDGKPLATAIGDLFWDFPYDRLPANNPLVAWTMRPEVVLGLILFYWISKTPLRPFSIRRKSKSQKYE
jgi:hypothetical protein